MKSYIFPIILAIVLGVVCLHLDDVTDYLTGLVNLEPQVVSDPANEYASLNDFAYVQKTDSYIPYGKQDLLNIFYSMLDNGYDSFTFYCPSEYTECLDDVDKMYNDQMLITDVGNFVHPYNSFLKFTLKRDNFGGISIVHTEKMYTSEMIREIDAKLDTIFKENLDDEMTDEEKVLKIHDYLINNTHYYSAQGEDIPTNTEESCLDNSCNAYGALILGSAKCSGYADAMAIAISKLGIKNYKVGSEKHVWNAIYLDGVWRHIDATWDDPIVESGATVTDTIRHKFFMIDTETLLSYDTSEHTFDKSVYIELK